MIKTSYRVKTRYRGDVKCKRDIYHLLRAIVYCQSVLLSWFCSPWCLYTNIKNKSDSPFKSICTQTFYSQSFLHRWQNLREVYIKMLPIPEVCKIICTIKILKMLNITGTLLDLCNLSQFVAGWGGGIWLWEFVKIYYHPWSFVKT